MRSVRTWAPMALVAVAALFLGGCVGSYTSGPQGFGGLPTDLPANPDPCAEYCKEWVPPVYRKVPRVKECACGHIEHTEYVVNRTRFEDVQVKPRQTVCRTGCGKTCEESLVMVQPGGYRWMKQPSGCMKYQYCKPIYKWCNRVTHEEGLSYCAEHPPEYETVPITEQVTKVRSRYVPPTYQIEYVDELYTPGHWRWRGKYDCAPGDASCSCRPATTRVVSRTCKSDCKKTRDCVLDGVARCN